MGLEAERWKSVNKKYHLGKDKTRIILRRPIECVSPKSPRGASALSRPRRIFSSFGNGGKNSGGGGCPGSVRSGMLGGADVNALRLCA